MRILLILLILFSLPQFARTEENPILIQEILKNNITIERLSFNTRLSDFGACIVNKRLIFSSYNSATRKKSGNYDLYQVGINADGNVTTPKKLISELSSTYNEGPVAYSPKTGEYFMTTNNISNPLVSTSNLTDTKNMKLELVVLKFINGNYTLTEDFPYNSTKYSTGHAAFSPSGDTLLFVSNKPGGQGETDIYMTTRKNKTWTEPFNLGPKINTKGKEMSPFLAAGGLLIFASNGIDPNEGLNLYYTFLNTNRDNPVYKFPESINTMKDDFGMVLSQNQLWGYFTSNRPGTGNDDIYKISFTKPLKELLKADTPELKDLIVLKSEVKEPEIKTVTPTTEIIKKEPEPQVVPIQEEKPKTEQVIIPEKKITQPPVVQEPPKNTMTIAVPDSILLKLILVDAETKLPLSNAFIANNTEKPVLTDMDGTVVKYLVSGKDYHLKASLPEYLNNSLTISAKNNLSTIILKLEMYKSQINREYVLENIYFDFGKWEILPSAAIELDKLVRILKDNPDLRVEIESHTDNRGTDDFNKTLSLKRAESVSDFVRKQGIAADRITCRGVGSSDPYIEAPKTENDFLLNRRTTFRITGLNPSEPVIVSKNIPQPAVPSAQSTPDLPVLVKKLNAAEIKGTNFRVQILASKKSFPPETRIKNLPKLLQNAAIIVSQEDNLYKYQIGPFATRVEALETLKNVRSFGQDALILEYRDNEKVK